MVCVGRGCVCLVCVDEGVFVGGVCVCVCVCVLVRVSDTCWWGLWLACVSVGLVRLCIWCVLVGDVCVWCVLVGSVGGVSDTCWCGVCIWCLLVEVCVFGVCW